MKIRFLQNLGYTYISPREALDERLGKVSNVILEKILESQLKKINKLNFKGKTYNFTDSNINGAIQALKDVAYDGLIKTSEKIYDLLTLGKSFEQEVNSDKKSFNINFIDWKNVNNNVFHVTQEFDVSRTSSNQIRKPDIVIFVNGIPFGVIECKRPDLNTSDNSLPVDQAVSQHIRNQEETEIPKLYAYTQLLIATDKNYLKYATTGTKSKFWSIWKEQDNIEEELKTIVNTPLSKDKKAKLFNDTPKYYVGDFGKLDFSDREVTEQDRGLYSLCRPDRLIELSYKYIVFDSSEKKITRYQQYFAVQDSIKRIKSFDNDDNRNGGVIWHTQGSGKSLTMVMLAKAISLEPDIIDPKIILVTDRVDLDDQIYKTFRQCGKNPAKAASGNDLIELIERQKESIITVVIDKFMAAVNKSNISNESKNIFILVDESHRSQYKTKNTMMKKVFPNGCYIGFTGTPIKKVDKNTYEKFGGLIGRPYKIDDAFTDKAVVPILYEGRHAIQEVNQNAIDNWFEIVTKHLTDKQKNDLKRKFSSTDHLNEADQKIYIIACDISEHFNTNWQGTGFKGQLTASSKLAAIKYKKYMDDIGLVSTEVLISPPDTREGHEDPQEETDDLVQNFWKKMLAKYGNEEKYSKQLINSFKNGENPEIIIVVDKLLTGFDEPKNTVLYIARSLREHTLLQAIARVNRLCEGKDFGYVIDYYGILGELDAALSTYSSLDSFDEDDVQNSLINVMDEINKLVQKHSDLWDIFKTIKNKRDVEEYERLLGDDAIRKDFLKRLAQFTKTLEIALSTYKFIKETPDEKVKMFKNDAKFFLQLRVAVKNRYAEAIDYKEYEKKVQKLIDTHIVCSEVIQVTELVNIFETQKFENELAKLENLVSKADTIAHRTRKTITEKMDEDPVFYKKFSEMLKEAIESFRQKILQAKNELEKRQIEKEYFEKVNSIKNNIINRSGDNLPEKLNNREIAKAFYGISQERLSKFNHSHLNTKDISADIAIKIDDIILQNKIVDWVYNADIQKKIANDIDDILYSIKGRYNIDLNHDDFDYIIENCLKIAKNRYQK